MKQALIAVALLAASTITTLADTVCVPDGQGGYRCWQSPSNCSNPWQMGCRRN